MAVNVSPSDPHPGSSSNNSSTSIDSSSSISSNSSGLVCSRWIGAPLAPLANSRGVDQSLARGVSRHSRPQQQQQQQQRPLSCLSTKTIPAALLLDHLRLLEWGAPRGLPALDEAPQAAARTAFSSSSSSSSSSKSSCSANKQQQQQQDEDSCSKMVGSEDGGPPQTLTGAVLSAAESSRGLRARGLNRRLVTAASLLETQKAKDSVSLLRDTEALDSDVRPPHVSLLSERLVDASIQLLTVVALCIFAVCAGLLVGAVVSRATLTPGMIFLKASRYGSSPFAQLLVPDTSSSAGTGGVSSDTTAVFRAQFLLSMPVNNMGAFIDSLTLYLELLYLPAEGLPDASTCFSASGPFDKSRSLIPNVQHPDPAAAAALLSRGRASYSTIKRHAVVSLMKGDTISPEGGGDTYSPPLLHILLPQVDTVMQRLLNYSVADGAIPPAVGPTLLLANLVPFVPGLSGLDAVSFYVGLNIPLQSGDNALRDALKADCQRRQRVYLQLRTPAVSATSMFFQQPRHPFIFGVVSVPCSVITFNPQKWPPETPPSFIAEVQTYELEIKTSIIVSAPAAKSAKGLVVRLSETHNEAYENSISSSITAAASVAWAAALTSSTYVVASVFGVVAMAAYTPLRTRVLGGSG
ncbi:hypothetical protein ACSSS7_000653 [Eimeria intestinalis]